MNLTHRGIGLNNPVFLRMTRLSPFIFIGCQSAAIAGVLWSETLWPDTAYFFLGSALIVVLARVCLLRLGEWWWAPVAVAAPWLIIHPMLESVRIGAISIPAFFLLIAGVPGALFFGSLLRLWWQNRT